MAGRGPAPGANPNRKDPSQRRRRNAEPGFEELPAEGYTGEYPPLPATWSTMVTEKVKNGDGDEELLTKTEKLTYLKQTRTWYETWARSPMATKFASTDWQRLLEIAPLKDQYFRRPDKGLAAELRLQEERLGATVMDRQRLRWRVADRDEQKEPASVTKLSDVRRLKPV